MPDPLSPKTGIVFNIQKYSVHDGPGIRTVVFLKGCPLRCSWCSNPESHLLEPQLAYNPAKCIALARCGRCLDACLKKAIQTGGDGEARIDRSLCDDCLACVPECPPRALIAYGETMTVDQVIGRVEEDGAFYSRSKGGVTLGGGEPLFQPGFTLALLKKAGRRRIKCAMETCGYGRRQDLEEACSHLQTLLFDIKTMDDEIHKRFTGVSNKIILENLAHIRKKFPRLPIWIRTPVIPGVNDQIEDIRAIAHHIRDLPSVRFELLPFHRLGKPKYEYLGQTFSMPDMNLSENRMNEFRQMLAREYPVLMAQ